MEKMLNYSDVYLVPNYSELQSRSKADTSVNFLGKKFKLPVVPSNMSSVINEDLAKWCSENDYFYIMHRFDGATESLVKRANKENWKTISISVGVNQADYDFIEKWAHNTNWRIDYVTIDVAHGHHSLVKEMINHLVCHRDSIKNFKIIAGNVCTPEAVYDLASWGADAVKVGIAGGGVCSTKNQTGFHIPMFSCVENCVDGVVKKYNVEFNNKLNALYHSYSKSGCYNEKEYKEEQDKLFNDHNHTKISIIADGGIRENGDFAKALVAGADMVMAGSVFAACTDAPGESVEKWNLCYYYECFSDDKFVGKILESGRTLKEMYERKIYKKFFGSASAKQKGEKKYVEGFEVELPCNGLTYAEKYQEITESLQSAISYAGSKDLSAFNHVNYITIK